MSRGAVIIVLLVAVSGRLVLRLTSRVRPSVTDGDFVRLAGRQVPLHGIDAPETRQACGAAGA